MTQMGFQNLSEFSEPQFGQASALAVLLQCWRNSSAQRHLSASRTSCWDSSQPWGMLSWSCFSVWVLPCLAGRDWAGTGCSHSHFSRPAGVFEHVWGGLPQTYVAEIEILTKDQKTFPTCFVALLNSSSLQGKKKAFIFFFFSFSSLASLAKT